MVMATRSRILLLVGALIALGYCAVHLFGFVQLFFEHSGIAVTQQQLWDAHANHGDGDLRIQEIPKIIHQVWHNWKEPGNATLPEDWRELREGCMKLNEGWNFMLWTEDTSREFIATEYSWFLHTYDTYRYPVQKTDAVRYFLIRHYGGIYMDLDNGCLQSLEALLYQSAWTTDGGRGALSNNILGGRPAHPFWELITDSLIPYNYNYIFPYITISYASGQWFETAMWQKYHKKLPKPNQAIGHDERLARIIMDNRVGTEPWIFFTQGRGGSWVNWDNWMWSWVGDHFVLLGVVILGLLGLTVWGVRRWIGRGKNTSTKGRYERVEGEELDVIRTV